MVQNVLINIVLTDTAEVSGCFSIKKSEEVMFNSFIVFCTALSIIVFAVALDCMCEISITVLKIFLSYKTSIKNNNENTIKNVKNSFIKRGVFLFFFIIYHSVKLCNILLYENVQLLQK